MRKDKISVDHLVTSVKRAVFARGKTVRRTVYPCTTTESAKPSAGNGFRPCEG